MRFSTAFATAALLVATALPLVPPVAVATASGAGQYAASSVSRMPMAEFKALLDRDAIVVLDVRSLAAYRAAHIPGALSVPLETVAARAAEFKAAGKPVVAYCA